MALEPIESQCLPTDLISTCLQTEVNGPTTDLGITCDQHVKSPCIVGFLDKDYSSHNIELAPISYNGQKFLPHWWLNECHIP